MIRQLVTAAENRCSGDQMSGMPLGNCGGVATVIVVERSGEDRVPLRAVSHLTLTS
mgnify:CR=1 FL=1